MNFQYNIVVAAYSVFVYVVSRAGRQVPPCTRNLAYSVRCSLIPIISWLISVILYIAVGTTFGYKITTILFINF